MSKVSLSDVITIKNVSHKPVKDREERVPSEVKVEISLEKIKLHAALVCGTYESSYNIKLVTYILCKELKDSDTVLSLLTMIGLDDPGHDVFDFTEELREIYAK